MSSGQQSLKSSVLCPNGGKIMGQYNVMTNLLVHYKKLEKAKPRDDAKSATTFRPRSSQTPLPPETQSGTNELEDRGVTGTTSQRRSSSTSRTTGGAVNRMGTQTYRDTVDDGFQGESLSTRQQEELRHYARNGVDKPKYDDHDLIERHKNFFSDETKPFTPRVLHKNRHASRLSTMSCYCPPRKTRSKANSSGDAGQTSEVGRDRAAGNGNADRRGTGSGLSDTLANATLRSIDVQRLKQATPSDVPSLNISLDADHMRWLKEQKTQQAASGFADGNLRRESSSVAQSRRASRLSEIDHDDHAMETATNFIGDEESIKYQEFMAEVTRDIIQRGIYTNRGLRQVFESHFEKRNDLKLSKMRELISELEQKLGLPPDQPSVSTSEDFGYASTLRPSAINEETFMDNRRPSEPRPQPLARSSPGHSYAPEGRPPLPHYGSPSIATKASADELDDQATAVRLPATKRPLRSSESPDVLTIESKLASGVDISEYDDEVDEQTLDVKTRAKFSSEFMSVDGRAEDGGRVDDSGRTRKSAAAKNLEPPPRRVPTVAASSAPVTVKTGSSTTSPASRARPAGQFKDDDNEVDESKSSSVKAEAARSERQRNATEPESQRIAESRSPKSVAGSRSPTPKKTGNKRDQVAAASLMPQASLDDGESDPVTSRRSDDEPLMIADEGDDQVDFEDGYETNEELLDTLNVYQKRLEMSNDVDERGEEVHSDGDGDRRGSPVPPRRGLRDKLDGQRSDDDGLVDSVEVSDLDDNESTT